MKIANFRQRLTKLNRPVDVKRAKISLWFSVFFGEDTGVFFGVASTKSSNIAGIPVQTILWVILWVILKRLVGFWLDFLVRDQVWLTFLPSSVCVCAVVAPGLVNSGSLVAENGHQVFLWVSQQFLLRLRHEVYDGMTE